MANTKLLKAAIKIIFTEDKTMTKAYKCAASNQGLALSPWIRWQLRKAIREL